MRFDPYLYFDGDCREAFLFYRDATGGTLATMLTYGESPMPELGGPAMVDKILHATLDVGGSELLGSDAAPGVYRNPQGFSVLLQVDTRKEAERIFAALAQGGEVSMPLQDTFWNKGFGQFTDRFGIGWMINCA